MKEEIGEIFLGCGDFVANEKPSPQHTKAYSPRLELFSLRKSVESDFKEIVATLSKKMRWAHTRGM